MSYCLIDENALGSRELGANKGLVPLLFLMERATSPEDLRALVDELMEASTRPEYHQIRRDFVTWLVYALLPSNGIEVSNRQLEELWAVKEMLKDRWADYRRQVNEEVRAEVALEIRDEVVRTVRAEVAQEVRDEVVRDVRREGLRQVLVMQLEARFGPGCVDASSFEAVDESSLRAMLAKVLDAESVGEVVGASG